MFKLPRLKKKKTTIEIENTNEDANKPSDYTSPLSSVGLVDPASRKLSGKARRASATVVGPASGKGGSMPLGKTLAQVQLEEARQDQVKAKQVNETILATTKRNSFKIARAPAPHLDPSTPLSPLTQILESLAKKYLADTSGKLASYIPKLAEVDPNRCGVCIVTTTGEVCYAGDCDVEFSIQSISKALVYDLALMHRGKEFVMEHVDVEPSGEAFNSLKTEAGGRPPNPMVNIGAIEVASMINGPFEKILEHMSKFAGRELKLDQEIYECEAKTGHKNLALAHLLTDAGMLCDTVEKSCEKYFKQCSVLVNAKDLATIAATLANNGVNPINNDHVTRSTNVAQVLSVMATCGMYNYAGSWLTEVGLPAKSGVGGGICCVVPGVLGIGVFSPLLDRVGNSHRGVKICEELSSMLGLSMFQPFSLMLAAPHTQAEITQVKEFTWPRPGHALLKLQRSNSLDDDQLPSLDENAFKCVCFTVSGNMSLVGMERIVTRFRDHYLNHSALVLDVKDGSRYDTSGLLLTETFCRRMVELGKVFMISMAEDSPSALKLQDRLGAHFMVPSVEFVHERLIALGCVERQQQAPDEGADDRARGMAALVSPVAPKKPSRNMDHASSSGGEDSLAPLPHNNRQVQQRKEMFSKFATSVPAL